MESVAGSIQKINRSYIDKLEDFDSNISNNN